MQQCHASYMQAHDLIVSKTCFWCSREYKFRAISEIFLSNFTHLIELFVERKNPFF
jgi:hypothetical protein